MKCYDKTGDKNPFWGKTQSAESISKMTSHPIGQNLQRRKPKSRKIGTEYGFRGIDLTGGEILMREVAKCERCGFADKRALQMPPQGSKSKKQRAEQFDFALRKLPYSGPL